MPTCKTFEKEMLLPHVLGGAGGGKVTGGGGGGGGDHKERKIKQNASTSTTAI